MDVQSHKTSVFAPNTGSSDELIALQTILVDTVLVPFLANQNAKFGYVPSPSVMDEASILFAEAINSSELPEKLGISANRAIKALDFNHCYKLALVRHLHSFLFKHFQQAIRTDPNLIARPGKTSQLRTQLLLASTQWYINVIGDGVYSMECLREVHDIFREAQAEYQARQIHH